ncbi:MAG TPA: hypothetical protein VH062_33070 [Polyangiaceae bacterium]|jgi:phage FluMu protein Com|nr:hypothetical protein [Polyangiaceae bacterium]
MNDLPVSTTEASIDVSPHTGELHCACGALLARWVEAGLELKCRRCKRIVTIQFPDEMKTRQSRA